MGMMLEDAYLASFERLKACHRLVLLPHIPHTHTSIQATAGHLWGSIPFNLSHLPQK